MTNARRTRPAADIAVGYAADSNGHGIAYAAISTGTSAGIVRIPFAATALPALEGRDVGYAAVAAVADHLKRRGIGRARVRLADGKVVADLSGGGSPPKALAMPYVKTRCLLHGLGAVRLEQAEPIEIRDLTNRARAEVSLTVAA
ncbi:MAG: hypothetical protein NVSMB64_08270 [Candidatus Velthaea sp.]